MPLPRFLLPLSSAVAAALLAGCVQVTVPLPDRYPAPPDPGPAPRSAKCQPPAGVAQSRASVAALVNAERRARGLPALGESTRLVRAAQAHACDIAAQQSYSHYGSDGAGLMARLTRAGYRPKIAVENTGRGFDSPERAVAFWMQSPGHRANILNPKIRQLGLGLAHPAGDRPYWVLNMGAPQ